MKLFYFGDVMGKSGRAGLEQHLPTLIEKLSPDFVMVNGENAAHGFGITEKICNQFFDLGVDVITTGNHAWDQREIIDFIDKEPRLLRPLNYPELTPGNGAGVFGPAMALKFSSLRLWDDCSWRASMIRLWR